MNVGEEKVFLYGMMKDITEERRRLTDMYFSLKDRVDALHKLEEKGIGELSTKGFIDLFNDRNMQIQIENVTREKLYQAEKELQKPRYDKIAATLEQGQAEREEKRLAKERDLVEMSIRESEQVAMDLQNQTKEVVAPIVPKNNHSAKKKAKTDFKTALNIIVKFLKNAGRPVRAKEIFEHLNENLSEPLTKKNFDSNIFYRAKKADTNIESVTPGFFQYKR